MSADERHYSWFARLPENVRLPILRALKPFVLPVHGFVDRWYHTEPRLRLARVAGTALWWKLNDPDDPTRRPGDPTTADEVIDKLYDYASSSKPFKWSERS